ncbi:MAG: YggT family protein [Nitrospinae bacterium]|nr:YggT family protein [Nitrospinota bacterium]
MFVFTNFLDAVAGILDMALTFFMWLIIIRALISWVSPDPYNPIVRFLMSATDPVLRPVQRMLPPMSGLDLSPLVVIFIIYFLQAFVVRTLHDIALRMN